MNCCCKFLSSLSNNAQSQNVTKQLREVTDLLNSYQQKISILNEEIDLLKQQLLGRDKELEQYKIQLKNLKRSRSSDSGYERNKRQLTLNNSILTGKSNSNSSIETVMSATNPAAAAAAAVISNSSSSSSSTSSSSSSAPTSATITAGSGSSKTTNGSGDSSDTSGRQLDIANDEIKLLRNKIARLEDDLLFVTQVRYRTK